MTYQEIEELAGHRQVPAWVVKLVSDAVAIEREACQERINSLHKMYEQAAQQRDKLMEQQAYTIQALDTIRTLRKLKEKNGG
jgi:hypothetical protein